MCDGQGVAHPRRLGIASHLGVIGGCASLGCAKSILVGSPTEPGPTRGSHAPLRLGEEIVGEVVRTQTGLRPVYVSVGHRLDPATARALVLATARRHRLPEPTRLADRRVAAERRQGAAINRP
jgi:deoxyribonuclease V